MYESGSSSAPRYSKRWLVTVDVDAVDASFDIVEVHEWSEIKAKVGCESLRVTSDGEGPRGVGRIGQIVVIGRIAARRVARNLAV